MKKSVFASKKDPFYSADHFALYQGDAVNLLKKVKENSVDMIFADPPYNLSNGGFSVQAGKRIDVHKGDWDKSAGPLKDFDFHLSWISACRRVLKPEGTIWISGTYHSIYQCGFALQKEGFRILNDIAWHKPNAPPNIGCRCFSASHESLIWACKDKKATHTFNYLDMKQSAWKGDFIKQPGKQMRSVWMINTAGLSEKKTGRHPTQKPLALLDRIILASTKEGDLVLDPFTGSSTTGISAYRLKRFFIGIDKERSYLELSVERFKEVLNSPQTEMLFNTHSLSM